jgi:O-acetyl-ADP-ribose deacetylase (regulator of RNase III)
MTIILKQGDIFKSKCEALVNPVNCEGVMGAGLALKFKQKFPINYRVYREKCLNGSISPYNPIYVSLEQENGKIIFHVVTKDKWVEKSSLLLVENSLTMLSSILANRPDLSIAIPALGCGLGGLNWEEVEPLMRKHLINLSNYIEIYKPLY